GEALEEVALLRDDGADVAWAIEHVYETPNGTAAARTDELPPPLPPAPVAMNGGVPVARLRLGSAVPTNWIPLVPSGDAAPRRLVRGAVLPSDGRSQTTVRGSLIARAGFSLFDEEIPREGVRLQRRYRAARWLDGRTIVWVARTRSPGHGTGASRLEYDL